jgi:hypothetical protein
MARTDDDAHVAQLVADARRWAYNTLEDGAGVRRVPDILCNREPEVVVDAYSRHELLDRTHVVSILFDTTVVKHPAAQVDIHITAAIDDVEAALGELYQLIGRKWL